MPRANPEATGWIGSPKQIAWARDIRDRLRPAMLRFADESYFASQRSYTSSTMRSGKRALITDANNLMRHTAECLRLLATSTDAAWWIAIRDTPVDRIVGAAARPADVALPAEPYSFARAVARRQRAGYRSNPGPSGALLGVGTLHELEVEVGGRTRTIKTPGKWLAWEPQKRRFHICTVVRKQQGLDGLASTALKAHRKFHGAPARAAAVVDAPAPQGAMRPIGLLRALVYRVPGQQIISPEKNPYAWHHAFGDTGHKGGTDYPDRVKPQLCRDRAGNLFICRRKGNIFTVDTWLRG